MRAFILFTCYKWSLIPYQKYFKKNIAWNITTMQLLKYPKESLGFSLGDFLHKNNFCLQEKLECHDVFHVLTGYGTHVIDEIAMQFYLLGNRKHSYYLYMAAGMGLLFYPEKTKHFLTAYQRGKMALTYHQIAFKNLLNQPLSKIKSTFLIQ